MGILWDAVMKDETFFNINPQYAECSVKARTHRDEFRARYSPTFNAS